MRWLPRFLLLICVVLGTGWAMPEAGARESRSAIREIDLAELPVEAHRTLALILDGGPFPYRKDGTVFFNREQLLPRKPRGYYTEYTVPTPRARDRGARRIVVGGKAGRADAAFYYTDDHYASFRKIRNPAP